jgi:integrase
MKLTDSIIKAAKPKAAPYPLADGGGLVLLVQPTGAKWWRVRYRFQDKGQMLSIGVYPAVSLKEARLEQGRIKALLAKGINPSFERKEQKHHSKLEAVNSFEAVTRLWWAHWRGAQTAGHGNRVLMRLEADVFPEIGNRPLTEVTAPMLLAMIKKIEARGAIDIAKRALTTCGQIFRYAIAHGFAERNPAADIKPADALKPTIKVNHARLDARELPELLLKIEQYEGQLLTKYALELMALTFVRTSELIGARWSEFDLPAAEWRIPPERMKMRTPHTVPLASQALAVLDKIKAHTGGGDLVFPSERRDGKTMSNNTILYALYRMGYHSRMTGHGFRGLASTILHEQGYPHDHIELQLAHAERNQVSAAYNHALYLKPRTAMMQAWADYLDTLKTL